MAGPAGITGQERRPRLSVLMIAYNVERYLAEALDSALMQDLDFDYEIVVGEALAMETAGAGVEPLLFFRGSYLGAADSKTPLEAA